MYFKRLIWLTVVAFVISGCTPKNYIEQNSALIVFKTPTIRYADMGFIYHSSSSTKVEIYSSGKSVMNLEIAEGNICMSALECLTPQGFNNQILSPHYPTHILAKIFRGKPIFGGLYLHYVSNGFTQNITKEGEYSISYSVLNKETIFRDTINNILIKIRKQ